MAKSKTTKRPTQAMAVAGLVLNLFIPGLGSLINNKREGVYQMVLLIIGIVLMFSSIIFAAGAFAASAATTGLALFFASIIIGIILMITAWVWGLITGIHLCKDAK